MLETIVLLVIAAVLISYMVYEVWNIVKITELRRNGVRVPGKITSVEWQKDSLSGSFKVTFRFATEGGRIIESVPRFQCRIKAFDKGQKVTVAYDRENPERVVIMGSDTQMDGSVEMVIILSGLSALFAVTVLF